MDLKKGQHINLDSLLKMSVKDKATAYFCGYVDSLRFGLPTEITSTMAKKIVESIKGKGLTTLKKYETLYNRLQEKMPDYTGTGYSLFFSTKELEVCLTTLSLKDRTALALSETASMIDETKRTELDRIAIKTLAEQEDKGLRLITTKGGLRYEIDATDYIVREVSRYAIEYREKLAKQKGVTEAIVEWIDRNGAECIVSPTIQDYINCFRENTFYPEIFKTYTPSDVEEAKQKGEYVSQSRLFISENLPLPTYGESPTSKIMFDRITKYLE